jgi:CheY-like chemotaxis protein
VDRSHSIARKIRPLKPASQAGSLSDATNCQVQTHLWQEGPAQVRSADDPGDAPGSPNDAAKIAQILRNLVSNALEFSRVADAGVTAAMEEPLNRPLQREVRHGGAPFAVDLPALRDTAIPSSTATPAESLQGTRVLLVDDNVDACELTQLSLELAGCLVRAAHDGGEALRMVREHVFDVAVLDIGLPVLDGYQLASAISERMGPQRPGLIALSGYGRPEDRRRALIAGFDAHLTKPADPDTLIQTIVAVIKGACVRVG